MLHVRLPGAAPRCDEVRRFGRALPPRAIYSSACWRSRTISSTGRHCSLPSASGSLTGQSQSASVLVEQGKLDTALHDLLALSSANIFGYTAMTLNDSLAAFSAPGFVFAET